MVRNKPNYQSEASSQGHGAIPKRMSGRELASNTPRSTDTNCIHPSRTGSKRAGRLSQIPPPPSVRSLRSDPGAAQVRPRDNPESILWRSNVAVTATSGSSSTRREEVAQKPADHQVPGPPVSSLSVLVSQGVPTETIIPERTHGTWSQIRPTMQEWLTSKLKTRVPASMDSLLAQRVRTICESFISQRFNAMIEAQVMHSTSIAISNLPSNKNFMEPITESIWREIDTRILGAQAGANAPNIQHANYAVPVEQSHQQLTEQ